MGFGDVSIETVHDTVAEVCHSDSEKVIACVIVPIESESYIFQVWQSVSVDCLVLGYFHFYLKPEVIYRFQRYWYHIVTKDANMPSVQLKKITWHYRQKSNEHEKRKPEVNQM